MRMRMCLHVMNGTFPTLAISIPYFNLRCGSEFLSINLNLWSQNVIIVLHTRIFQASFNLMTSEKNKKEKNALNHVKYLFSRTISRSRCHSQFHRMGKRTTKCRSSPYSIKPMATVQVREHTRARSFMSSDKCENVIFLIKSTKRMLQFA